MTFNKLHLEHGLHHRLSFETIIEHGRRENGRRRSDDHMARFGLVADAAYLKTGLLPPYLYRGVKKLFPKFRYRRVKAASVGAALVLRATDFDNQRDRQYGRYESVALGDKIHIGGVSILQTVETGKTRMDAIEWRQKLYRFELGWRDRLAFGSEAHFFEDRGSSYAALSHLRTLSWRWPDTQARVKLMVGSKRETGFVQSDVGVVEFEILF